MRVVSFDLAPKVEVPFLNAGRRAGGFYEDRLPVFEAVVEALPPGLDAIVVTSDLQGRECFARGAKGPPRLLGEVLPRRLVEHILPEMGLSNPSNTAAFLAGDFYTVPALDRRGGTGDVTSVWHAFGERFSWVAGVPGNHDTFGAGPDPAAAPRFGGNLHYLDGHRKTVAGLRLAGLGGIVGDPSRLHRRTQEDYLGLLESLLSEPTDILITHDGPDVPQRGYRGLPLMREVIECFPPKLVVRGHTDWPEPLAELTGGIQVLNVEARVVVLRA